MAMPSLSLTFRTVVACVVAVTATLLPRFASAQTAVPPRIAIFAQRDFPYYGVSSLVTPSRIAEDLRASGLTVELLDADTLANATRFSAGKYAAVILPYGNTYPRDAFANLRRFHQAGGSLVTTGIPFTHPAARLSAQDWEATPGWGTSVQTVAQAGPNGANAIRLRVGDERWTGITSVRVPVTAGAMVTATMQAKDETPARVNVTAGEGREDNLYVRFFDASGKYLRQDGPAFEAPKDEWRTITAQVTVPAGAVAADVSAQLHRTARHILLSRFTLQVGARVVTLPNADFSRPGTAYTDTGHNEGAAMWGPDGIGMGTFHGPDTVAGVSVSIAPGDPMHLTQLLKDEPTTVSNGTQWLAVDSLPSGVRVIPALGTAGRPIAALIVHGGDAFRGAVDAWTYRSPAGGDREEYETRQMIERATLAVLIRRGKMDPLQAKRSFSVLDGRPAPPLYTHLYLPTVPRKYATFQPKMPPPARHLYVADVRALDQNTRTLLLCLQGIVNRKQPRIYLVFDDADQFWLEELQRQKATDDPIPVANPLSLIDTFRSAVRGAVLPDPAVYESSCVALSLAGADDLLLATSALASRLKLPIKADLRKRFKGDADALRFLRTKVAPRLDPYLAICLDPNMYGTNGAIDQIVAARGAAFWITGPKVQGKLPGADEAGELGEVRALLARMPLGAVVRGFWWHGDGVGLVEDEGVALGSRFGKVTLVSDIINNLSVQSGVQADRLTQKAKLSPPVLNRRKVYIAFTMSDGDNLCTWREYFRRYFNDPVRGTFPVGWGMGPSLIDLAPTWARWYYEQATANDEFICDVSGVAYMYPPSWGTALADRDNALRWFYGKTEEYMGRMDMKTVRLMNVGAADIAQVGPLMPKVDFLMSDYGYSGEKSYHEFTYSLPTGQSVFRAATNGRGPQNLADQIRERAGEARPSFLNAFIWNWGSSLSDLKKVLDILGPDYVAVTPSQLNALYRESQSKP